MPGIPGYNTKKFRDFKHECIGYFLIYNGKILYHSTVPIINSE